MLPKFPLVSMKCPSHLPNMNRIKTLSVPLISALIGSAALPADAQVSFSLSHEKTYRQDKRGIKFTEGSYDAYLEDGNAFAILGCEQAFYVPPGVMLGSCAIGTTGFLTAGSFNESIDIDEPYFVVTNLIPAAVIAPRDAASVTLIAAPASELVRPSGGFVDDSFSLYFNLNSVTSSIREYDVTRYSTFKYYSSFQRQRFSEEIVPGVYHYSFPRLNPNNLPGVPPAIIKASINPMAEGNTALNNRLVGFAFKDVNQNKWNKGFVELSYNKPNKIFWQGLTPGNVVAGIDRLYFSMKVISNPRNPKSDTDLVDHYSGEYHAVFPDFQTTSFEHPRIWLANPFVGRFTTPPIFAGGTKAVVELELDRNLQTGGVTYEFSNRRFQIPVVVINRYSEYVDATFDGAGKANILEDADGDGHNNLNEWILDSSATDRSSIPDSPFPMFHEQEIREVDEFENTEDEGVVREAYYGFTINKKLGTIPNVVYTLQRSKNFGRTWSTFKSDEDWSVETVRLAPGYGSQKANSPERVEIRVESKWNTDGKLITDVGNQVQDQPPGTAFDIYRVKITLKKKK
jgi:hypothetical protein